MATYNKFLDFVDQLGQAKHNLNTDQFSAALSNVGPVNTNTILSNITQIANGNGYTTGGIDTQNTWAEAAGTGTMTCTMCVWTSTGAGMAAFQYVVIFNETQTSPVDPLMCWFDYGSALTLAVGETFSLKFNSSATTGSLATLT